MTYGGLILSTITILLLKAKRVRYVDARFQIRQKIPRRMSWLPYLVARALVIWELWWRGSELCLLFSIFDLFSTRAFILIPPPLFLSVGREVHVGVYSTYLVSVK